MLPKGIYKLLMKSLPCYIGYLSYLLQNKSNIYESFSGLQLPSGNTKIKTWLVKCFNMVNSWVVFPNSALELWHSASVTTGFLVSSLNQKALISKEQLPYTGIQDIHCRHISSCVLLRYLYFCHERSTALSCVFIACFLLWCTVCRL